MALPPYNFYSIYSTTTLSGLVNVESLVSYPPQSTRDRYLRLTPGRPEGLASGGFRDDGFINGILGFDQLSGDDLDTLVIYLLGSLTAVSNQIAISGLDANGRYSPFTAYIGYPSFELPDGGYWRRNIVFPLSRLSLQSVTKTSNYTVTTSDHYCIASTSGGSVTFTLPAASGVNPYVVFSFVKSVSASNSMVIARAGSDTIDGATSVTKTALNARVDIYSDGASKWYSVSRA